MKKKKTIFANNQSVEDVICQALIFAIGTGTALLIATGLIVIFSNLINS
tara:strand:- start:409 stop:555 length:147 start_codon:yes stop_codon:yes gene_type:complete